MEFFDYLLDAYGATKPYCPTRSPFRGIPRRGSKKALKSLCDEGKVIRFERGVYYIRRTRRLRPRQARSPKGDRQKVYLRRQRHRMAIFRPDLFEHVGPLFANAKRAGALRNNEPSRVREVPVGSQRVLLRRARTATTATNAATLSFLELMNFTDAAFYDAGKKKTVAAYIEDNASPEAPLPNTPPASRTGQCALWWKAGSSTMLHDDRGAVRQAVLFASEALGIEPGHCEKDYYVTMFLRALFRKAANAGLQGRHVPFQVLQAHPALFRGHRPQSGG